MRDEKSGAPSHRAAPFNERYSSADIGHGLWFGIPDAPRVHVSVVASDMGDPQVMTRRSENGPATVRRASCALSLAAGAGTHATCRIIALGGGDVLCVEQVQVIAGREVKDTVGAQGLAFSELCSGFGNVPGMDVIILAPETVTAMSDFTMPIRYVHACGGTSPDARMSTAPCREQQRILWVEACHGADTYKLYTSSRGSDSLGLADVPTYDDSVRLNRLFRKIRENESTDRIEESEDEEDFENVDPGKWVTRRDRVRMLCTRREGSRGWVPHECVEECCGEVYKKNNAPVRTGPVRQQRKLRQRKRASRQLPK